MRKLLFLSQLLSGPMLFALFYFLKPLPGDAKISYMAGIIIWIALWWLTEVVELAVTSLLPLVLLPVTGILNAKATALQYNDQVIFLFVGGFILSFGIEKWGVHKRMSLKILSHIGNSPVTILSGIMISTGLISMWMSNTATVMMLLSAVLAIIYHIEEETSPEHTRHIATALLLGLAYAASIGGMATLVGTPTNMIFSSFYESNYPERPPVAFTDWFLYGFPTAFLLLLATFYILKRTYLKKEINIRFDTRYFKNAYKMLGKPTYEEKWMVAIFSATALLWFTRETIRLGPVELPGWTTFFQYGSFIQDSTVAIAMAGLLFLIPSRTNKGQSLLIWEDAKKIPYEIILLFGSGFALAKGFETSGLSAWIALRLNFLQEVHPFWMILGICFTVCLISEFASNVASIQLVLPILAALSQSIGMNPMLLMVPATLSASLGFMLPVATAANTIVFGTHKIPLKRMLRSGFWIDLTGIILITFTAMVMLRYL